MENPFFSVSSALEPAGGTASSWALSFRSVGGTARADHRIDPTYATTTPYKYDSAPPTYDYPYLRVLPYSIKAHHHDNTFDIHRVVAGYGIESPKSSVRLTFDG